MQEDLENRSVTLICQGSKLTGRLLAKAMSAALRQMRKPDYSPGKTSVRDLAKGGELQSIAVADTNIKAFDPVARKYGIRYSVVKDVSEEPPKWLIFFKAKDTDAMTAAFKEFIGKSVKRDADKPSVREAMAKFREVIKHAVIDRTRHKERGEHEL